MQDFEKCKHLFNSRIDQNKPELLCNKSFFSLKLLSATQNRDNTIFIAIFWMFIKFNYSGSYRILPGRYSFIFQPVFKHNHNM